MLPCLDNNTRSGRSSIMSSYKPILLLSNHYPFDKYLKAAFPPPASFKWRFLTRRLCSMARTHAKHGYFII